MLMLLFTSSCPEYQQEAAMRSVMTWQASIITLAIIIGAATGSHASEADHFEGKPSETVTEAVENLSTHTDELVALTKSELGPVEMARVHEVTYTLENALARINEEYDSVAEALEAVHQASERADADTVKVETEAYAEALSILMPAN